MPKSKSILEDTDSSSSEESTDTSEEEESEGESSSDDDEKVPTHGRRLDINPHITELTNENNRLESELNKKKLSERFGSKFNLEPTPIKLEPYNPTTIASIPDRIDTSNSGPKKGGGKEEEDDAKLKERHDKLYQSLLQRYAINEYGTDEKSSGLVIVAKYVCNFMREHWNTYIKLPAIVPGTKGDENPIEKFRKRTKVMFDDLFLRWVERATRIKTFEGNVIDLILISPTGEKAEFTTEEKENVWNVYLQQSNLVLNEKNWRLLCLQFDYLPELESRVSLDVFNLIAKQIDTSRKEFRNLLLLTNPDFARDTLSRMGAAPDLVEATLFRNLCLQFARASDVYIFGEDSSDVVIRSVPICVMRYNKDGFLQFFFDELSITDTVWGTGFLDFYRNATKNSTVAFDFAHGNNYAVIKINDEANGVQVRIADIRPQLPYSHECDHMLTSLYLGLRNCFGRGNILMYVEHRYMDDTQTVYKLFENIITLNEHSLPSQLLTPCYFNADLDDTGFTFTKIKTYQYHSFGAKYGTMIDWLNVISYTMDYQSINRWSLLFTKSTPHPKELGWFDVPRYSSRTVKKNENIPPVVLLNYGKKDIDAVDKLTASFNIHTLDEDIRSDLSNPYFGPGDKPVKLYEFTREGELRQRVEEEEQSKTYEEAVNKLPLSSRTVQKTFVKEICNNLRDKMDKYKETVQKPSRSPKDIAFTNEIESKMKKLFELWAIYGPPEPYYISHNTAHNRIVYVTDPDTKKKIWNRKMGQDTFRVNQANLIALCKYFEEDPNLSFLAVVPNAFKDYMEERRITDKSSMMKWAETLNSEITALYLAFGYTVFFRNLILRLGEMGTVCIYTQNTVIIDIRRFDEMTVFTLYITRIKKLGGEDDIKNAYINKLLKILLGDLEYYKKAYGHAVKDKGFNTLIKELIVPVKEGNGISKIFEAITSFFLQINATEGDYETGIVSKNKYCYSDGSYLPRFHRFFTLNNHVLPSRIFNNCVSQEDLDWDFVKNEAKFFTYITRHDIGEFIMSDESRFRFSSSITENIGNVKVAAGWFDIEGVTDSLKDRELYKHFTPDEFKKIVTTAYVKFLSKYNRKGGIFYQNIIEDLRDLTSVDLLIRLMDATSISDKEEKKIALIKGSLFVSEDILLAAIFSPYNFLKKKDK